MMPIIWLSWIQWMLLFITNLGQFLPLFRLSWIQTDQTLRILFANIQTEKILGGPLPCMFTSDMQSIPLYEYLGSVPGFWVTCDVRDVCEKSSHADEPWNQAKQLWEAETCWWALKSGETAVRSRDMLMSLDIRRSTCEKHRYTDEPWNQATTCEKPTHADEPWNQAKQLWEV